MADEEIEGKGFVIKDRRRFTDEGELKEETAAEEKDERPEPETEEEEKAEPEAAAEQAEQMPFRVRNCPIDCNNYVKMGYLGGAPGSPANGMAWMESDGLHVWYGGAEHILTD